MLKTPGSQIFEIQLTSAGDVTSLNFFRGQVSEVAHQKVLSVTCLFLVTAVGQWSWVLYFALQKYIVLPLKLHPWKSNISTTYPIGIQMSYSARGQLESQVLKVFLGSSPQTPIFAKLPCIATKQLGGLAVSTMALLH